MRKTIAVKISAATRKTAATAKTTASRKTNKTSTGNVIQQAGNKEIYGKTLVTQKWVEIKNFVREMIPTAEKGVKLRKTNRNS